MRIKSPFGFLRPQRDQQQAHTDGQLPDDDHRPQYMNTGIADTEAERMRDRPRGREKQQNRRSKRAAAKPMISASSITAPPI